MNQFYKLFLKYILGESVMEFLIDVFGITARGSFKFKHNIAYIVTSAIFYNLMLRFFSKLENDKASENIISC